MTPLDSMKQHAAAENMRMLAVMDRPGSEAVAEYSAETILSLLERPHTAQDLSHKLNRTPASLRYRINKLIGEGKVTSCVIEGVRVYEKAEAADASA